MLQSALVSLKIITVALKSELLASTSSTYLSEAKASPFPIVSSVAVTISIPSSPSWLAEVDKKSNVT